MTDFVIGCYTFGAGGRGRRIEVARHDPASGRWELLSDQDLTEPIAGAATTDRDTQRATGQAERGPESPSYLAWHPDGVHLYAAGEESDGQVWALRLAPGGRGLGVLGSATTGGAHPCHLAVDPSGRVLITANYTSGSVAVHRLRPDGRIGDLTHLVQHEGSGPHAERQAGPHAHMVYFADQTLVLVVDLGADLIAAYRLDPVAGRLAALGSSGLPTGFGPRHLVALPGDRLAVAGELTGEIALLALARDTGAASVLDVRPASDVTESPAAPSGIGRTADGRFVVMANRGPDTVTSFAVSEDRLSRVDEVPGGGDHPRDLTVLDDRVYVANQESDSITVLRLDPETGELGATGSRFDTPSPTQVLPIPASPTTPTAPAGGRS
ncbi:lactonase family protein [Nakamurella sp.]|uniref:lactonase family protein n=1 Tax=Nakamurella sp. TaxID=1869182 RepID=UPI003B3A729A